LQEIKDFFRKIAVLILVSFGVPSRCYEDELAIIVTGGSPGESAKTAEALSSDGTPLCFLPNLPNDRRAHTMDGDLLCGGLTQASKDTCLKFENGGWTEFSWKLLAKRRFHVSWKRADGKVMLLGGLNNGYTTELVTEDGSLEGFPMKYETESACGIQFENEVIITGGEYRREAVSVYDDNGWVQDLPSLNRGRFWHACGHYTSDYGINLLVTGGFDVAGYRSSTELLTLGETTWRFGQDLPSARYFPSNGVSILNDVILLGGKNDSNDIVSEILKLDKESGSWMILGNMSAPRTIHASSVLPMKDIKPFCVYD